MSAAISCSGRVSVIFWSVLVTGDSSKVGYAWLTNSRAPVRTPERLLLVLGMTGFLIVGLAIPSGFGRDGVAFGLGYLLVVLVHAVLYARVNRHIWRIAPFNVASAVLVIAAGFAGGVLRDSLWVAAL